MADLPLLPDDRNPHPQIQQDLKGDRNQAIDSTIVNFAGDGQVINLTINDRIPSCIAPTVEYCGTEPRPERVSSAASLGTRQCR
jgi:hypothetical protein